MTPLSERSYGEDMTATDALINGDWREYGDSDLSPVLRAAVEAFNEVGYHGATVRDIARRAGLSVAGLYHHHAGKQDMLVAILRHTIDDMLRRNAAARRDGGDDPVRRFTLQIESLTLAHLYWHGQAALGSSEMRSLEPAHREEIRLLRVRLGRCMEADVEAATAAGRFHSPYPREALRGVIDMCIHSSRWFRPGGELNPEQIAQRLVRVALAAMEYDGLTADAPALPPSGEPPPAG